MLTVVCAPTDPADPPRNDPRPDEAQRLHATWQRLGIPGAIDVHTHFMPHNVMAKVWAYFDRVGDHGGVEWPITYRTDEDDRVARLREFGVRRFTSMLYPHKPAMADWLNAWSADFAARTPDCLRTFTFYPEEGVGKAVAAELDAGARIGKAHLQVGAYDPRDPLLDPVWGLLAESGTPLVIHCGSGPTPGPFTGPGPIGEVLRRHPDLRLVIAHLGMPEYAEFLDLADAHEGVHLDTTMVFTDFSEQTMPFPADLRPRLLDLGDRVLLGTDFPNIPHDYLHQVEALERLDLGEDWLRGVLHDNAAALFEVPAPGAGSIADERE
ncbi:amidohydrolase [Nocardioides panacisoli]|uniref:amidohydrolase family protein n=1 Tax=Nocardioides panacisoli TaxID=627624 RepID=UPI001C627702|nr:amidohydrolase family protein [Nocardioides panacisoli]QYJ03388.1 amidohydrolase [Nocardioides panacisoli]